MKKPEFLAPLLKKLASLAPGRLRKPVPLALKLVAATFGLAVIFIAAAILGGQDDGSEPTPPAPLTSNAEAPAGQTLNELGYPDFATNNTTRIGGSDPASNAAGSALAVFPSTEAKQRPSAVVIANADDWQTAIAASVLMAAPVGAPLLIAEGDELPEPTAQALDMLDPQGSALTNRAQVFAVGGAAAPADLKMNKLKATGPAGAAAIAKLRDELFGSPPQHVLIAPAERPEFAMPAAAWAARSGDPVLFTNRDAPPAATIAALKRYPDTPLYLLGPDSAISAEAAGKIAQINDRVQRVSGENAVENAIAMARFDSGDFGWNINDPGHGFVVARSDSPLDAAASAPLSASGTWGPLLLTDSADTLPPALRGYLLDVKPGYSTDPTRAFYNHVWVIGDQEAIDVKQQAEIDELAELARIGQ